MIMKRFIRGSIKLLLISALLFALFIVAAYPLYSPFLFEKIRVVLMKELNDRDDISIDIASVSFAYIDSLKLRNISVSSPSSPEQPTLNIEEALIKIDLLSLFSDKRLKTTVRASGIQYGRVIGEGLLRTSSLKAASVREAFDFTLLKNITVIRAKIAAPGLRFNNIYALAGIKDLRLDKLVSTFSFLDRSHLLALRSLDEKSSSFSSLMISDNIRLESRISIAGESFLIESLTGNVYCFTPDVSGYFKTSSRELSMTGTVITDLSRLELFPGISLPENAPAFSGKLFSDIRLSAKKPEISALSFEAITRAPLLKIADIGIEKTEMTIIGENGRVRIPSFSAISYRGKISGDLRMDLLENKYPFIMSLSVDDLYLERLIEDLTGERSPVYGSFFSKLAMEGYLIDTSTYIGTMDIEISEADLGPMPILSPLIGDIYSILRGTIMATDDLNIRNAYAEFAIRNRRLTTRNAIMWGSNIAISAEGSVGFDGKLDLIVENKFLDSPVEEIENWQTALRNTLIRFGKALGKARLRGTVTDPKWEFDYFPRD
jgi:hypothetical protein